MLTTPPSPSRQMPQKRVGDRVQWSPHRGSVEPPGEDHAHQLLALKCFARDKTNLTIHLRMDGMYALTYQLGGTEQPGQGTMSVVHGKEHPTQSPAPGWCPEHHC